MQIKDKSNNGPIYASIGESYRLLDMEKVPLDDQYEMCGLFKQSTFGDIDIKCKCASLHCYFAQVLLKQTSKITFSRSPI